MTATEAQTLLAGIVETLQTQALAVQDIGESLTLDSEVRFKRTGPQWLDLYCRWVTAALGDGISGDLDALRAYLEEQEGREEQVEAEQITTLEVDFVVGGLDIGGPGPKTVWARMVPRGAEVDPQALLVGLPYSLFAVDGGVIGMRYPGRVESRIGLEVEPWG